MSKQISWLPSGIIAWWKFYVFVGLDPKWWRWHWLLSSTRQELRLGPLTIGCSGEGPK